MTAKFPPGAPTPAALRHQTACRELCRVHGSALVTIAQLVMDDTQDVCEVVAEAVAAECRAPLTFGGTVVTARQRLARSVFDRSRGRLVTWERFGQPTRDRSDRASDELPSMLRSLGADVRATVALTIFGWHGLSEAAAVLSISPETVLRQLREALSYAHRSVGAMEIPDWEETGKSTRDGRLRQSGFVSARQRFASGDDESPVELPGAVSAAWASAMAIPTQRSRTGGEQIRVAGP